MIPLAPEIDIAPAYAATTVVEIDPATQFQTIQGWGTSLAWWAEGTGGWSSTPAKDALADALFSPSTGLGLNVIRYNIGATTPTDRCAAQMRVGGAVPSFEQSAGNYDWSQDPNQRWMLQAAKSRGADVFEATTYSAPDWMTINHCSAGADTKGADNLSSSQYQAYAKYLATVVGHFRTAWGIPFSTVEPFNEPVGSKWSSTGRQQAMNVSPSAQNAIVGDLHTELAAAGVPTGISAPDSVSSAWTVSNYNSYSAASKADVTQINTHDYGGGNGAPVAALGKRTWMSEWGAGPDSADASQMTEGIDLSRRILTNEQQMHPAAWVIWQAMDGPVDGGQINDLWGLVWGDISPSGTGQLTFPKRYYVMGNYSKFVRPGNKMIYSSDANSFVTYDPSKDQLVVVATNPTSAARSVHYDLSHFSVAAGTSAAGYRTSATQNLASLADTPVSSGGLSVTLPAESVTTYVIPHATASGTRAAAVAAYGSQMEAYGRAADGSTWSDVYTPGHGWSNWASLGGNLAVNPTAVRYGSQMEVFGRAGDGSTYANAYTPGKGWSDWQNLGGNTAGSPVAIDYNTQQDGDQMEVFGRAGDGSVRCKAYTPGVGWSDWQSLGGNLAGDPTAVQYGNQLELYGRAANGSTWSDVYSPGSGWSSWTSLGGHIVGNPAAIQYDSDQYGAQLELYGRAADGSTWSIVYTPGSGWSSWYSVGGTIVDDPVAVQYSTPQYGNQMELYGRAAGGGTWSTVYTPGSGWSDWYSLGGNLQP